MNTIKPRSEIRARLRQVGATLFGAALGFAITASALAADAVTLRVGDQKGGNRSLLRDCGTGEEDLPYKIEWSEFPAAAPISRSAQRWRARRRLHRRSRRSSRSTPPARHQGHRGHSLRRPHAGHSGSPGFCRSRRPPISGASDWPERAAAGVSSDRRARWRRRGIRSMTPHSRRSVRSMPR